MRLGPRRDRAALLGASPDPLAPPDQHRPTEARGVVQADDSSAMTDRDDSAGTATRERLVGLDIEHHGAVIASGHVDDVYAVDTEEFIGPGAPRRTGPTRTVGLEPSCPTPRRE